MDQVIKQVNDLCVYSGSNSIVIVIDEHPADASGEDPKGADQDPYKTA